VSTLEPSVTAGCAEAEKQLQAYVDRALSKEEVVLIEAHLAVCDRCARCYQLEPLVWQHVKQACAEPCPERLKLQLRNLCEECGCE
jgi:anti-sigma factor (TIGR02949 family)